MLKQNERLSMFKDMASILSEAEGERFKLKHFTVDELDVKLAQMKNYAEYRDFLPGTYVKLVDKNLSVFETVVMSNTQMEQITNLDVYHNANGHVLIGGLGIGMILLAIQDKPNVTKITVIEKYQEVIDLVAHQLPLNEKVEIIQSDIFEFKPARGVKYDTVYMDIWNDVCGRFWNEHKTLSKKFQGRLNKENSESWSNSWRRADYKKLGRDFN